MRLETLDYLLEISFAGIHIDTDSESMDLRTTKKGVVPSAARKGHRPSRWRRSTTA